MDLKEFIFESIEIIDEGQDTDKPLRFTGIFQKFDEENENKRIYSKKLWESVLSDSTIISKLENRQMLGELRHPEYREINMKNSSHVITKLQLDENIKRVRGEAEVLKTPDGKILETLLRAGVRPGISSRGEGGIRTEDNKNFVEEKNFKLVTFDMTMEPSVIDAFPSVVETKLGESIGTLISNDSIPDYGLHLLETLVDQFKDVNLATNLKSKIHESLTKESTTMSADDLKLTLDKLEIAMTNLMEEKAKNTVLTTKNEKLDKEILTLKETIDSNSTLITSLEEDLKEQKDSLSSVQEELDPLKEKYGKSVKVLEGITEKYGLLKTKLEKITGFYEKSLKVIEGIRSKLSEDKVNSFLKTELKEFGGIDKFKTLLGDTKTLEEAKEKVENIKKLAENNLPFENLSTRSTETIEEESGNSVKSIVSMTS